MAITENLVHEETLPLFGFRGHCHCFEGPSTQDFAAGAPTNIIQSDQPWSVVFHFSTQGLNNHIMAGKWQVQVLLEQMGGKEITLDPSFSQTEIDFISRPSSYSATLQIPQNKIPPGVYRVVGVLTFKGPLGVPGPIAAFADMGLVQFYKEGPSTP